MGTQRTRLIADRVARATLGNSDGFAIPGAAAEPGSPGAGPVDVEAEMVSLADEQIRFEATAKLLTGAYEKLRLSIRGR